VPSKRKSAKEHAMNPTNRLSKKLVRARQAKILDMFGAGKPIEQIATELDMHQTVAVRDLNIAIDRAVKHYAESTPQQTFVRYAAFQMGIIKKLNTTFEKNFNDRKNSSAAIQALMGQSSIYDKILAKGHEYGVIEKKKADRKAIEGKSQDIKQELITEITMLQKLVSSIDETTQAQSMLQDRNPAVQSSITYFRIIRKPLKNEFGVIKALPDWKYRRKVYADRGDGTYTELAKSKFSEKHDGLLPEKDIDDILHKQLLEEQGKKLVELKDSRFISVDREEGNPSRTVFADDSNISFQEDSDKFRDSDNSSKIKFLGYWVVLGCG
jgi:hypothetical protein